MDADAIAYMTEHMMCSPELATYLVRERARYPLQIACRYAAQKMELEPSALKRDLLSAIECDKIKITKVSSSPGTTCFGEVRAAEWQSPSCVPILFTEISRTDEYEDTNPAWHELSRPAYRDIIPSNPSLQTPYSYAGKGSAVEQAIYLFDPNEICDWAQRMYQQSEKGTARKKKAGGPKKKWDYDEIQKLALARMLIDSRIPDSQAEVMRYLRTAFSILGYQEDADDRLGQPKSDSSLQDYADEILRLIDRAGDSPSQSLSMHHR